MSVSVRVMVVVRSGDNVEVTMIDCMVVLVVLVEGDSVIVVVNGMLNVVSRVRVSNSVVVVVRMTKLVRVVVPDTVVTTVKMVSV